MKSKFSLNIYPEYEKWLQSIKTALTKNTTYKFDFFLMMFLPIFVFFFIKYSLWVSIYEINDNQIIQGYTLSKMIRYQFCIFLFDLFVRSHFFSQNLSSDIRLGRISAFLLYPFHFISYQMSLFISDKIIQVFIGGLTLAAALGAGFISFKHPMIFVYFIMFVLMVNLFWFFTQTLVGLLAFWIEETWSLNISIRFISAFLSGAFIPLDLYPDALRKILIWTPFPYLTYFPVKIIMGDPVPILFGSVVICFWLLVLMLSTKWLWKKGLRLYAGAGI